MTAAATSSTKTATKQHKSSSSSSPAPSQASIAALAAHARRARQPQDELAPSMYVRLTESTRSVLRIVSDLERREIAYIIREVMSDWAKGKIVELEKDIKARGRAGK